MLYFYNNTLLEYHDGISPFDRGLTLGDGIFETIKVVHNQPELWQDHYTRLVYGCSIFGIKTPDNLLNHALDFIQNHDLNDGVLKIIVTRGSGGRGLDIDYTIAPNIIMTLSPLPKPIQSLKAHISPIKRNETSPLSRVKSLNYGDNIIAKKIAVEQGYDEALMLNAKNQPTCFTSGNIVIKTQNGEFVSPPSDTGCLDGTYLKTLKNINYRDFDLSDAVKIYRSNCITGLIEVVLK